MAEILVISPMEELARLFREVIEEDGFPKIDIKVARVEEGVQLAQEAENQGYHVIISRGVTAWMMHKAAVSLPVVEVLIGGFDILKAYLQAKKLGKRIGIVDIEEIIQSVREFEKLVGEEFVKYTLTDQDQDIFQGIRVLKEADVEVVIGKIAMAKKAEEFGMKSVVIGSGREAVRRALAEAIRVQEVRKQEQRRTGQLKAILNFIYDGVIALDDQGCISVFNPVLEKLTGWTAEKAIGRFVTDVIPKAGCREVLMGGKADLGQIIEIGRSKVVANRVPIIVDEKVEGVVTTFQTVDRLQSLEHKIRRTLAERGHVAKHRFEDILGQSNPLKEVVGLAKEYALVNSTVLLLGKTGSGKEMFAQAIHNAGPRHNGPFVAINCAALPENLLESELFGYVEGAFTGARKGGKAGVFEMAHGGTLFLDEVGEMAPSLQARLLRVLEEGEVMRLGDSSILPIDVRLITATHRNLREMVDEGSFREDLFYRLNVLSIIIPQLADRGNDILLIAKHFLELFCHKMNRPIGKFSSEAEKLLIDYSWPGNIRELRNAMERLVMQRWEKEITVENIFHALLIERQSAEAHSLSRGTKPDERDFGEESMRKGLENVEQNLIRRTLQECRGNKTEAARRLGISRTTLWRKLHGVKG
ncbi:sigma 54-interacting transcriptional regulator [Desulfosporosinus sp. SYSU MS00001]|uniref:sigma 54-interacting transcriptional regulator n=1 Tax=Desulfosporosinus sp. SYSU MS00001 TaxID=3416284 RepID=UPI003CF01B8C